MLCPKCLSKLYKENNSFKCINNHTYDISKEGYINLLLSKTNSGDNKDLINGRINFLNKDYYYPLVDEIIKIISNNDKKQLNLCDCGCGIGYYAKKIKASLPFISLVGSDISKEAIKYAAKNDKSNTYIVASNQKIPFENEYFDYILHVFSPLFENEAKRLLKKTGKLILVTPGALHLFELKEMIYSNPYYNIIEDVNYKNFNLENSKNLKYKISINCEDFHNLVKMTPYYYKTKKEDIEKINFDGNIFITIDFIISIFSSNN